MNNVNLLGRITADIELKHTPSNVAVVSFSLAVDRGYKNEDGTKQTDFIDIVAWRNTAEFIAKYFSKGQRMAIQGRLQTRDWEDKNGNKRKAVEVIVDNAYFADGKKSEAPTFTPMPDDLEMDEGKLPF